MELPDSTAPLAARASRESECDAHRAPRDLQRALLLILATLWLLDAVLQVQPSMFTPGPSGLSGMLNSSASANPGWIAHTITWNASIFYHHPVLANTLCAVVQFSIAFGIVSKRTCKPALALSIAWALGVWWFGEGLGAIFTGGATPLRGGPGGALFYVLLAVLLWPSEGSDQPFVAARTVGPKAARVIWITAWALMSLLTVVGSGRSPRALHDLVARMNSGQPGWLAAIDRHAALLLLHDGTPLAVSLGVLCIVVAGAILLPPTLTRVALVLAIAVFASIWVATQNFGGILAVGATDPNSGPLVVVLALTYWPLTAARATPNATAPDSVGVAKVT